ncbi:flagellar brake protein [Hahella sp. CCB-MM4]|uniref:flagellar brake protein n=1 Tax=Hahella sp. (strain CCB-MM4) TaxID=1926491 RepID=UPI000B9BAD53|nr:flagellar brake protein [Hahella sp. CCB-MM4]OZG73724.1 flagellar brake protein [Hahella sp. CCB-MM4]
MVKVAESPENKSSSTVQEMQLPFEKMGLRIGDPLHLEGVDHGGRYHVKLIGYAPGQGLIVSMPVVDGKQVLLKKDRPFTVRSMARTSVFAFNSFIKHVAMQPFPHLFLEYPKELIAVEVRNASRLKVELPSMVTSDFDAGTGEWPKEAVITDISKSGAGVKSVESLGALGDEIKLQFLVSVSGISKTFKISAVIRNKTLLDPGELPYKYTYGLQYLGLSDAAKIVLTGYIYELQAQDY